MTEISSSPRRGEAVSSFAIGIAGGAGTRRAGPGRGRGSGRAGWPAGIAAGEVAWELRRKGHAPDARGSRRRGRRPILVAPAGPQRLTRVNPSNLAAR
jgi:hypothetical protein